MFALLHGHLDRTFKCPIVATGSFEDAKGRAVGSGRTLTVLHGILTGDDRS